MGDRSLDIVIVGGGIVGLATARALSRRAPQLRLAVLEKESSLAFHQTGHNSGVIHSGIYYRPGSLKATLSMLGGGALKAFCETHHIPVRACGKVIVAGSEAEILRLAELYRRGTENGVPGLTLIGPEQLRELEPHAGGIQALHVPGAAVVDFRQVASALAQEVEQAGGQIPQEHSSCACGRTPGGFFWKPPEGISRAASSSTAQGFIPTGWPRPA